MLSCWLEAMYTPPICITICLPFVSRYLCRPCRSIRVRGCWHPPKSLFEWFFGGLANFRETAHSFLSGLSSANFSCEFFGLVSPGFQAPQKNSPPNSRAKLSALLSNFRFLSPTCFSRRFSAYGGDQKLRVPPHCVDQGDDWFEEETDSDEEGFGALMEQARRVATLNRDRASQRLSYSGELLLCIFSSSNQKPKGIIKIAKLRNEGSTPTPWARRLRDQIQKKGCSGRRKSFMHRVYSASEVD